MNAQAGTDFETVAANKAIPAPGATVAEVLRSLATGEINRSETARLRDVFDDVENALQAGVVRTAILEALNAQGFTMTLKSFESALYRIRKQRASAKTSVAT